MKFYCTICGWVYDERTGDEDNGIAPGTRFTSLPEDYECPACYAGKEDFAEADE